MKKLILIASAVLLFAVSASAQNVDVGFGLGGSYPKAPDTVSFDSKLFVNVGINKFFAVGLETGFGWIKRSAGDDMNFNGATIQAVSSTNFYSFPILLTATVFFPVGDYESPLKPYVSGGAGYSVTNYAPSGNNYFFHGFTWQAAIGLNYNLGSEANNMSVFIEGGYRGTMLERDMDLGAGSVTAELDMSGPFVKAGVSFPISASNY